MRRWSKKKRLWHPEFPAWFRKETGLSLELLELKYQNNPDWAAEFYDWVNALRVRFNRDVAFRKQGILPLFLNVDEKGEGRVP